MRVLLWRRIKVRAHERGLCFRDREFQRVLGPGVHFGEMALVDRSPRSASVRARGDTRLMSLSRKSFFGLVRTEPVLSSKLLWSFVQGLSQRLRATNDALSDARTEAAGAQPFGELEAMQRG